MFLSHFLGHLKTVKPLGPFFTLPLWRDLVKILTRKQRHAKSLECTDFETVTFEKIP